jgi:putative ABC transport system permease protein
MRRPNDPRIYAAALRLLPDAFRERFADEMLDFAALRLDRARQRGPVAAIVERARLAADLGATICREWIAEWKQSDTDLPPTDTMDNFLQDLRFGIRSLVRRPGFSIIAAVTIALGIGANTAIFSVVNAVLIRPLPYHDPDRLALIWGTQGKSGQQGVVYADYLDWRARSQSFTELGAFRGQSITLTGGESPERLIGDFVSSSFLRVIDLKISQGRAFTDAETEVATKVPVAIVTHEAWQNRFGGDRNMLGKPITLNGTTFTVVGITAPHPQVPLGVPDVMMPIGYYPNAHGLDRGVRGVAVAGRLKPGVSLDAAQRDLSAIMRQLEREYPATNASTGAEIISLREYLVGRVRESLLIILAAVGVVLLIACANVANLQLARGAARARELSVRAALGAGRRRLAQQLLTESVLLSLVGGVLGIVLALAMRKGLATLIAPQLPVDEPDIRLDLPVLLFALGTSMVTGLLFGIAPAWKASRTDITEMLRSRIGGGIRHGMTRSALVVVQLALSLVLLVTAGLLTRSLQALQSVDPGFDGRNLLTAQFRLPATRYNSNEKIWEMFERTTTELRSIPGVEAAALVRASPFSQNGESYPVLIEGQQPVKTGDAPMMQINSVTPGYFATMRIPVVSGRDLASADRGDAPHVIVVNKSFAERTWPRQTAVGKRIQFGEEGMWTIVGVVGDTKHYTLNEPQLLQGYVAHAQRPQIFTSIVVRTKGNPTDYARAVREAVWRVDRDQPIWRFKSMEQDLSGVVQSKKTMMWLTGLFAVVALLVAVVGVYGVLSYTVAQRTQEIGIRIALGADARQVSRMVIGDGLRLVGVAVVAGLALSLGASRFLRNQLFGIPATDLLTLVAVTFVLGVVALLACYIPARRASRVDPLVALRMD